MSDNLDFILRARKAKQATDKAMAGIRKKYNIGIPDAKPRFARQRIR